MISKLIKNIIICLNLSLIFAVPLTMAYGASYSVNRIELLVNENAITNFDIIQRMKINAILRKIEISDENYNQLINSVIDDLIVEKLKNEKIIEYDINFEAKEFEKHEERFYSSIEYEKEQLEALFSLNDINYDYLTEFIETELKWQKLIYGLFLRVTSVTEQEVFDIVNSNPTISEEMANEIVLQKQLDIKSKKLIKDLKDEATIEYR